MFTAMITAAIVAVLAFLGVRLTAVQIAGVAIVVKVALVITTVLAGLALARRRRRTQASGNVTPVANEGAAPKPDEER